MQLQLASNLAMPSEYFKIKQIKDGSYLSYLSVPQLSHRLKD